MALGGRAPVASMGYPGADLHHDQCLANRQRSSIAAGNRLTAEISEDPPSTDSGHEQHHGDREAIMEEGKEFQCVRALSRDLKQRITAAVTPDANLPLLDPRHSG